MALRFIWERRFPGSSVGCPVCLVTQLSADRLDRLVRLCECWDGPVAAAVLAPAQGEAALRGRLQELCERRRPQPVALRLARLRAASRYYPVNAMRNATLELAAPYPFVLISDVDLLPSRSLLSELGMAANLAGWLGPSQSLTGPPLSALIVPSLEPSGEGEDCVEISDFDVGQARAKLQTGQWRPFCWAQFPAGHRTTDFGRWLDAPTGDFAYGPVDYEEGFEPFCVLPREALPPFDERLSGYGRNKCLFYLHLHSLGCAFYVFVRGCLFHAPHPASESFTLTFGSEGQRAPGRADEVVRLYESAKDTLLQCSPTVLYSPSMATSRGCSLASYDKAARAEALAALRAPHGESAEERSAAELRMRAAEQRLCLHGLFAASASAPSADTPRVIHLSSGIEVGPADVTWVTHCSQDRLPQLRRVSAAWRGPLAVAVLALGRGYSWASLLRDAHEIVDAGRSEGRRVDLLMLPELAEPSRLLAFLKFAKRRVQRGAVEGDALYPANSMRQLARNIAATKLALLADVDFLPSQGLSETLAAEAPALVGTRRFMVVPALELVETEGGSSPPRAEELYAAAEPHERLRSAFDEGTLRGFHAGHFPQGHGPTDLGRWLERAGEGDAYEVYWEEGFEPYGVADLSLLPPYDRRFDEVFIHDKESFFMELALGKDPFTFSVFPRGFLVSMAVALDEEPPCTLKRASSASRLLANALARRKLSELRWARSAPALAAGLFPRGCDCPAHAPGAPPPFVCSRGARGAAVASSSGAEAGATPGLAEAVRAQRWEITPDTILCYAKEGRGRLRLDGEHEPAYLKGQVSAAGVRVDEDSLVVRLAQEGNESMDPFRVRLEIPAAPWVEHCMRVVLRGSSERFPGRLPGLRLQLPWGAKVCSAFKWDPGGWGGYWADVVEGTSSCRLTYLGKRPFQLGAAVSQLVQRAEMTDGGRVCLMSASVNGLRVFSAKAERMGPAQAAAREGTAPLADLDLTASPDLCAFLKDVSESSRTPPPTNEEVGAAEVWLSSIEISSGLKA